MDVYREAKDLIKQLHCYSELKETKRLNASIGSLGGGNHFIELDKDESPMVYKPKDEIISNIQDTVSIVNVITPIYNFKAAE